MNVDMSPIAVTIRLKRVSQLRRLCLELGKMKPVASETTQSGDTRVVNERPVSETQEERVTPKRPRS